MVYFIGNKQEQKVKIGSSGQPIKQRFITIQSNCPFDVEILLFVEGMRTIEKYLHNMFKSDNIRGEWFRLSPEIQAFINNPQLPQIEEKYKPTVRISNGDDEEIESLYSQGSSLNKIAEQTGYTYAQVRTYVTRRKLYDKYKQIRCSSENKHHFHRGNKKYHYPLPTPVKVLV